MNRIKPTVIAGLILAGNLFAAGALAASLDTVNWAPDATVDGTGTGTLNAGAITVSYTTVAAGNAGVTLADNWDTSLATDSAAGSGVTHNTAGILGSTESQVETIDFSAAVSNPILLVNFTDATSTFDFGSLGLTLLDNNNAQLTGDSVAFAGSTNSANDGFAVSIAGTFGPGTPLQFSITTRSEFDSVAFTIGTAIGTSTPEPASFVLAGLGAVGLFLAARRRKA